MHQRLAHAPGHVVDHGHHVDQVGALKTLQTWQGQCGAGRAQCRLHLPAGSQAGGARGHGRGLLAFIHVRRQGFEQGQAIKLTAGVDVLQGQRQLSLRALMRRELAALRQHLQCACMVCAGGALVELERGAHQPHMQQHGLARRGLVAQGLLPVAQCLGQRVHALRGVARGHAVAHGASGLAAGLVVARHCGRWRTCGLRTEGETPMHEVAPRRCERAVQRLAHQVVREGVTPRLVLTQQVHVHGMLDDQHGVQLRQRAGRRQQRRRKGLGGQCGGFKHTRCRAGQALHTSQHSVHHAGGHRQLAVVLRGLVEGCLPGAVGRGFEQTLFGQMAQRFTQEEGVAAGGLAQACRETCGLVHARELLHKFKHRLGRQRLQHDVLRVHCFAQALYGLLRFAVELTAVDQQLARACAAALAPALGHQAEQAAAGGVGVMPVVKDHGIKTVAGQAQPGLRAGLQEAAAFGVRAQRRRRRAKLGQHTREFGAHPLRQLIKRGVRTHQRAQAATEGGVGHVGVAAAATRQSIGAMRGGELDGQSRLAHTGVALDEQRAAGGPGGLHGSDFGAAADERQRLGQQGGGRGARHTCVGVGVGFMLRTWRVSLWRGRAAQRRQQRHGLGHRRQAQLLLQEAAAALVLRQRRFAPA